MAKASSLVRRKRLSASLLELIRRTSTELPDDVVKCIEAGRAQETAGSLGHGALGIVEQNVKLARTKSLPLCQDTGSILFYIHYPAAEDQDELARLVRAVVKLSTKQGHLRQNLVSVLTGKMSETNVGPGSPTLHFVPWKKKYFEIRLMLKGAGCENVSAQYSLPDMRLNAGRDLKGVKRCVVDAVQQAQGRGCGPGILGVAIGGDRVTGYAHAKEQFLRKMTDHSPTPELAALERECTDEGNKLGIGPMGLGGKTTLLGTKFAVLDRLPGAYYVSVSYMCWAFRRQGVVVTEKGEIKKWLY